MSLNYHSKKTLGRRSAALVTELYERGQLYFSLQHVRDITKLKPRLASNLVGALAHRGLVTRLSPGRFRLVPFELGKQNEYLGNPYLVARELAGEREYCLSHSSAMDLHQMVTQPQLVVYATSTTQIQPRTVLGTEFRFVTCRKKHFFGITEQWVSKTDKVLVSDLEKTVIDGLKQPQHCGGFADVAKGFWIRRENMNIPRLVDYALRLDVGAVLRRLGFLLETSGVQTLTEIERLRKKLTATYHLLDPVLPAEGKYITRWRLRLNVSPEELKAARGT